MDLRIGPSASEGHVKYAAFDISQKVIISKIDIYGVQLMGCAIMSHSFAFDAKNTPEAVFQVLLGVYGESAGAEALLRAFLSERERDRAEVRFWISVYELITSRANSL